MDSVVDNVPASSESLQSSLLVATTVTFTLTLTALILRFLARRLRGAGIWLDDWLILGALFAAIGYDATLIWSIKNGFGQHIQAIRGHVPSIYHNIYLGIWILDHFYSWALGLAKLSILSFYWRVFKSTSIKLPIKVVAVLVFCWIIVRVLMTIFHCIPVQGYWDKSIPSGCTINDRKFFFGTVLPHLLIDIIILSIPVPYIKGLQVSWPQKLGIYAMFLFGGFVCFASVVQLVVCLKLDITSPDITWLYAPVGLWAAVEVNLAIVAACLPSLRPIYILLSEGSMGPQRRVGLDPNTYNSVPRPGNQRFRMKALFRSGRGHYPRESQNSHSESIRWFAPCGRANNHGRSFSSHQADSSRRTRTTCGPSNTPIDHINQPKHVIMVKNEIDVEISTSDWPGRKWSLRFPDTKPDRSRTV